MMCNGTFIAPSLHLSNHDSFYLACKFHKCQKQEVTKKGQALARLANLTWKKTQVTKNKMLTRNSIDPSTI